MSVQILDVQPHHLPQIEKLEQQCFSLPWTWDQLMSQLPDDCHEFLAAEQEGKVLGYVGMMTVLDEGYISNVAVDPAFRRQGIAEKLVTMLIEEARARGVSEISLDATEAGRPLYRKMGFKESGECMTMVIQN